MSDSYKERYWVGDVQAVDDFKDEINGVFIDGKTKYGPWAIMTVWSFARHGVGLGTGKGQQYKKQRDGRWMKVKG